MVVERCKVAFIGNRQAGCVGLLALYAAGCTPAVVASKDPCVIELAANLRAPVYMSSIKDPDFLPFLDGVDLLLNVHGKEIIPDSILSLPRLGGINVHPCLSEYKGLNPIGRLLRDGKTMASVGVHRMTSVVDAGEVLVERFVDVGSKTTREEVYNVLYPYYAIVLLEALEIIKSELDAKKAAPTSSSK